MTVRNTEGNWRYAAIRDGSSRAGIYVCYPDSSLRRRVFCFVEIKELPAFHRVPAISAFVEL